jgi:hypothetical protein
MLHIDDAVQHVVGTGLGAKPLPRLLRRPVLLLLALVPQFFALERVRHHPDIAGVHVGSLQITDERARGDMLHAPVANAPDDHHRLGLVFQCVLLDPGMTEAVGDHVVGYDPGIGVVPVAAEIGGRLGIDATDFLAAGGKESTSNEYNS